MRGFLISALAETRVIRFCSFIFSIIESSDCIDAKISTDSLYSLGPSFILSYLQEPKSTSSQLVQKYSKRYLCFLLLFLITLDNERVNWFNIIQLLVFLAMPLSIYSGISIVLLANRLLPLAINFEYSKIVFVSRSLYRRNSCIVAPFQLCQNFLLSRFFLMLPNCISVNIYYIYIKWKIRRTETFPRIAPQKDSNNFFYELEWNIFELKLWT